MTLLPRLAAPVFQKTFLSQASIRRLSSTSKVSDVGNRILSKEAFRKTLKSKEEFIKDPRILYACNNNPSQFLEEYENYVSNCYGQYVRATRKTS